MSRMTFKHNEIERKDGKITIPIDYLRQIGEFIEGANREDNVFREVDIDSINRGLMFLAGIKKYGEWSDLDDK